MILIGERINASNKSAGKAIIKRDNAFITGLTQALTESEADMLIGKGTLCRTYIRTHRRSIIVD